MTPRRMKRAMRVSRTLYLQREHESGVVQNLFFSFCVVQNLFNDKDCDGGDSDSEVYKEKII